MPRQHVQSLPQRGWTLPMDLQRNRKKLRDFLIALVIAGLLSGLPARQAQQMFASAHGPGLRDLACRITQCKE
jgi:hypothetical protein